LDVDAEPPRARHVAVREIARDLDRELLPELGRGRVDGSRVRELGKREEPDGEKGLVAENRQVDDLENAVEARRDLLPIARAGEIGLAGCDGVAERHGDVRRGSFGESRAGRKARPELTPRPATGEANRKGRSESSRDAIASATRFTSPGR